MVALDTIKIDKSGAYPTGRVDEIAHGFGSGKANNHCHRCRNRIRGIIGQQIAGDRHSIDAALGISEEIVTVSVGIDCVLVGVVAQFNGNTCQTGLGVIHDLTVDVGQALRVVIFVINVIEIEDSGAYLRVVVDEIQNLDIIRTKDKPLQKDIGRATLVEDALLDDQDSRDAAVSDLVDRLGKVGKAAGDLGLVEEVAKVVLQQREEGRGFRINCRLIEHAALPHYIRVEHVEGVVPHVLAEVFGLDIQFGGTLAESFGLFRSHDHPGAVIDAVAVRIIRLDVDPWAGCADAALHHAPILGHTQVEGGAAAGVQPRKDVMAESGFR